MVLLISYMRELSKNMCWFMNQMTAAMVIHSVVRSTLFFIFYSVIARAFFTQYSTATAAVAESCERNTTKTKKIFKRTKEKEKGKRRERGNERTDRPTERRSKRSECKSIERGFSNYSKNKSILKMQTTERICAVWEEEKRRGLCGIHAAAQRRQQQSRNAFIAPLLHCRRSRCRRRQCEPARRSSINSEIN